VYDFIFGKMYPLISDFALFLFLFDLIIVIPISFFRKAKHFSGTIISGSSYIFGLQLWLSGLLLTLQIWGIWAVIIGLLLIGIGVIPIAMIATLFHGMWMDFAQLLLSIILVFGTRILGARMLEKSREDDRCSD
jgi:hypothetical protein